MFGETHLIFTTRRYAVALCLTVCPSVRLSQVWVLYKNG